MLLGGDGEELGVLEEIGTSFGSPVKTQEEEA